MLRRVQNSMSVLGVSAGLFLATAKQAAAACGWSLLAQADIPIPQEQAEPNFVLPSLVVILIFGAALYAVCRSSQRV